jgi:membrane fusion protein, multidrug efflux system
MMPSFTLPIRTLMAGGIAPAPAASDRSTCSKTSTMFSRPTTIARNLTIIGVLAAATACSRDAETAPADTTLLASTGRVINVETRAIEEVDFSEQIRLTGTVTAHRDVTVAAEENGVIRQLPVPKGSRVAAGTIIARIDDRILRTQVAQARAQAELTAEVADRRSRLFSQENIGSELAVLEARAASQQARANLEGLTERLNRTIVRAPVSGILESRAVEVGSMVSMGTPVGRIIEVNPAKITAGVPERFAGDVVPGSPARITFDVLPGRAFDATISYVGTAVNPRNRTFPVEVVLPNAGYAIKPEMVANVEVVKRSLRQAIVVPQEALVRVENGFVAFVVEERDGRSVARVRRVVLGASQRNQVVVESGLSAGEQLIIVGQQQVADGDRVAVIGAAPSAPAPVASNGGER